MVTVMFGGALEAAPILFGAAHSGPDGPSTLYSIDHTNGAATLIGDIGFERVSGMDFHPVTGVLYATGERSDMSDTHVRSRRRKRRHSA